MVVFGVAHSQRIHVLNRTTRHIRHRAANKVMRLWFRHPDRIIVSVKELVAVSIRKNLYVKEHLYGQTKFDE